MSRRRVDRLRVLLLALLLGVGVLWVRSAELTVLEHDNLRQRADDQQRKIRTIRALRGPILDRRGVPIAFSVEGSSLGADPTELTDVEGLARALDDAGLLPAQQVRNLLAVDEGVEFVWLTRRAVPETDARALQDRFGFGLIRHPEPKRLYPLGRSASTLIGATGIDGNGLVGFEGKFESSLRGIDGRLIDFRSGHAQRHSGPGRVVLDAPRIGASVALTIDARFQQIVHAHLRDAVLAQQAKGGAAILLDPHTGAILALASMPEFDPTDPGAADTLALRNWAVAENYEPGSTYKLIAFAGALEAGLLRPEDPIDCHDGTRTVPGGAIRDHEPNGIIAAQDVLAVSSNIGTGIIAEILGEEGFYRTERLFGFGVPTEVEIAGEERGWIPDPSSWSRRSLVTQAFGQEISCTVLQLAAAYGVVANGGLLMKPYLLSEVREADGTRKMHKQSETIRRAIRPETARLLRRLLRRVVTDGTGTNAEVPLCPPAGKTGTSQRWSVEENCYSNDRYVASFAGFAPYDAPRWVCVVVLEEPRASIWGGSVAAPVFARIIEDVSQIDIRAGAVPLRAVQEEGVEAVQATIVPAIEGLERRLARRVIKQAGLIPRFVGDGAIVERTSPESGSQCENGGVVRVHLGGEADRPEAEDRLPDFRDLSLRDALARARLLDLELEVEGSGWVVEQVPEPSTPLPEVDRLMLRFSSDSCLAFVEREGDQR